MKRWLANRPRVGEGSSPAELALDTMLETRPRSTPIATAGLPTDLATTVSRLQGVAEADRLAREPSARDVDTGWQTVIGAVAGAADTSTAWSATRSPIARSPHPQRFTDQRHGEVSGRDRRKWSYGMSYVSRAMLVVAVAILIGGSVPVLRELFNDDSQHLAFQPMASPTVATGPYKPAVVTNPLKGGGDLPLPSEPEKLEVSDCNVEPRTEANLLSVLSTTTGPDGGPLLAAYSTPREGRSIDRQTFDDLQATYHTWLACAYYGQTFQLLALESDNAIRAMVYNDYGYQATPYSSSTILEIVDGWVELDSHSPRGSGLIPLTPFGLILDPTYLSVTDDGKEVTLSVSKGSTVDGVWQTVDAQITTVTFVLEDGYWRVLTHGSIPVG